MDPPTPLIAEKVTSTELGAPRLFNIKLQVVENMIGESGFEPVASWSRNKENQPSCCRRRWGPIARPTHSDRAIGGLNFKKERIDIGWKRVRTAAVPPPRGKLTIMSSTWACRIEGAWKNSPAAAVPVRTKMPEPMMAPMPGTVSDHGPSVFFRRWPGSSASAISLSIDLQAKSWLLDREETSDCTAGVCPKGFAPS